MTTTERNFADFSLGADVYALADGVIPEIAERFDIQLASEPTSEELGMLVGKIGKNKVLRDNNEVVAVDRETQVAFVERSGVQQALDRSLRTPEHDSSVSEVTIMTGAVANWMDRGTKLVANHFMGSPVFAPAPRIITIAGTRVMDSATEKPNAYIQNFLEREGRYPIEAEYARDYVTHSLQISTGIDAEVLAADTANGAELARQLFVQYPELLDAKLTFARVANAGIQLAVQMRTAAQELSKDFDADPNDPQVFVLTDSLPLAETDEQENQPRDYQKAATALRQVALTAKMLHEAAGGE